ncbi:hypothetical protein C5167_015949 [Papaver somniferum]|nr:hypothetical protein C5167_015949 [Papaver somniferum]
MGINDVTSLDVFMLDDNGEKLHGMKIFCPARSDHRLFFKWDTEVKPLRCTSEMNRANGHCTMRDPLFRT